MLSPSLRWGWLSVPELPLTLKIYPSITSPSTFYHILQSRQDLSIYCDCMGWRTSRKNPKTCKHLEDYLAEVRNDKLVTNGFDTRVDQLRTALGIDATHEGIKTPYVEQVGPDTILLELSAYQAKVLATIVAAVSGNPHGPRGVANEIYEQLRQLGFRYDTSMRNDNAGIQMVDKWTIE